MLPSRVCIGGLVCCRTFSTTPVAAAASKKTSLIERLRDQQKHLNSKKAEKPFYPAATLSRIERRKYRVLVVNPDGSSYTLRNREPRPIMTMPVDITTLSERERMMLMRGQQAKMVYSRLEKTIDKDRYTELVQKQPEVSVRRGRRLMPSLSSLVK
eukprot:scpid2753/ scgid12319/ 